MSPVGSVFELRSSCSAHKIMKRNWIYKINRIGTCMLLVEEQGAVSVARRRAFTRYNRRCGATSAMTAVVTRFVLMYPPHQVPYKTFVWHYLASMLQVESCVEQMNISCLTENSRAERSAHLRPPKSKRDPDNPWRCWLGMWASFMYLHILLQYVNVWLRWLR
jgi:hypothetical protein